MTLAVAVLAAVGVALLASYARWTRGRSLPVEAPNASARRTGVRLGAAAALLIALVAAAAVISADGGDAAPAKPQRGPSVLVVDVSGSISTTAGTSVAPALRAVAARAGDRAGLVVFADAAAVVLPTTATTTEIAHLTRFFGDPRRPPSAVGRPSELPLVLRTSWAEAFVGGTAIARGLTLAQSLLVRDRVPSGSGRIFLISDLDDGEPESTLVQTMARILRAGTSVFAVPVGASAEDVELFERLGARVMHPPAASAAPRPRTVAASEPGGSAFALALCAVAFAAALLALHAWSMPLRFRVERAGGA